MTSFKNLSAYLFFIILFLFSQIIGCDYPTTFQPKGDYISGWATFADTNYASGPGYYAVALYSCGNSPMSVAPIKTDSIPMSGLFNPFYFRISLSGDNNCYLAVVWKHTTSEHEIPVVLGTYGCDTTRNCSDYKVIAFPNFTGASYNMTCWADTTKKLN